MSSAISRSERRCARSLPATVGGLDIVADGDVHARRQNAPLRLFRPHAAAGEPPTGVVANVSGGILGGDRLSLSVDARGDALITGQAAEKVYRSAGATARVCTDLAVGAGAALEWLPQGTILFDGARLDRRTTVRAAPGGRCLAGEILVFGRVGMGETLRRGAIRDRWRVERGGRPLWIDALRLDGDIGARMAAPYGFAGARAQATVLYVADDAAACVDRARDLMARAGRAAATVVGGVLIARWLSADPAAARAAFGRFWRAFRAEMLGRPARLPAVWHV